MANHIYPARPDLSQTTDTLLSNPTNGQFWFNKTNRHMYIWSDGQWVPITNRVDYAANWGQISHGQTLPNPVSSDGYVFPYDECIWSVSPAVLGNFDTFICFADLQGLVTSQYRVLGSTNFVDSIANYIIIGIRGNRNKGVTIAPSLPIPTPAPTVTPTQGASATPAVTPSASSVIVTQTPVLTPSGTPAITPTPTVTPTLTPTQGVTITPTQTSAVTPTVTPSGTPVATPTGTPVVTPTATSTVTPTPSPIPPMTVSITDPEGSTNASSLISFCNLGIYDSFDRDSGYAGCSATNISLCNVGSCAPEPGDRGLGPVMRVTVSGGVPPYTVRLKNFQPSDVNRIENPDFELGDINWTKQTGWTISSGGITFNGSWSAKFDGGTSASIRSTLKPVTPGKSITGSAKIYLTTSSTPSSARTLLEWFNSSQQPISFVGGTLVGSNAGTWQTSSVTGTAPSGAAFAALSVSANKKFGQGTIYADNFSWNLGNSGTSECFFVGGVNIPSIPFTGIAKTYSISSSGQSTPIISLNGICGGSLFWKTGTFDIEVIDTIGATQSFIKNWEIYRINDGTGSTDGGGGAGCVATNMFMDSIRLASDILIGDWIDGSTYDPDGLIKRQVRANRIMPQPCLRLTTESGISIIASTTTPMTMPDASCKMLPEMLDELVLVDDEGDIRWEKVVSLDDVGVRDVVLFSVDDQSYFAGESGTRRIATHNVLNEK